MNTARARRREQALALVALAAGGALGFGAASRTWGTATLDSGLSDTRISVTGGDLLPLTTAISLVALAAVVAVPAVRRAGRRIIGGVLALLGAVQAVTAEVAVLRLDERVASWVASDAGESTGGSASEVATSPGWGLAVVAAGALILAAGLLAAVRGPSWPAMGARYERPDRAGEPGSRAEPSEEAPNARETWDALDRGHDPT